MKTRLEQALHLAAAAVTFAAGFGLNPIVAGVDQCGFSAIRWNFGLILKCRPQEPQQPATTHRIRIHC
ncbi:MAG: hypothetical protein JWO04_3098 [Gammaproteobacteria bacterium]|jgi:hypothetical protein|nr:hypothetical protein [Gammaproteobacteria bacterium]